MVLVASVSRMRAPGPGVATLPMIGPEGESRIGESVIWVSSIGLLLVQRGQGRPRGSALGVRLERAPSRKLVDCLVIWPERALLDVPYREGAQVNATEINGQPEVLSDPAAILRATPGERAVGPAVDLERLGALFELQKQGSWNCNAPQTDKPKAGTAWPPRRGHVGGKRGIDSRAGAPELARLVHEGLRRLGGHVHVVVEHQHHVAVWVFAEPFAGPRKCTAARKRNVGRAGFHEQHCALARQILQGIPGLLFDFAIGAHHNECAFHFRVSGTVDSNKVRLGSTWRHRTVRGPNELEWHMRVSPPRGLALVFLHQPFDLPRGFLLLHGVDPAWVLFRPFQEGLASSSAIGAFDISPHLVE